MGYFFLSFPQTGFFLTSEIPVQMGKIGMRPVCSDTALSVELNYLIVPAQSCTTLRPGRKNRGPIVWQKPVDRKHNAFTL